MAKATEDVNASAADPFTPECPIQWIRVEGLQGTRNIEAKIRENTLILIGENGSGKTTLLRLFVSFLSGDWVALAGMRFDRISAQIRNETIAVTRKELAALQGRVSKELRARVPAMIRRRIDELFREEVDPAVRAEQLRRIAAEYGLPPSFWHSMTGDESLFIEEEGGLQRRARHMKNMLGARVLYLPTYRRIERELKSIVQDYDMDMHRHRPDHPTQWRDQIELVEFGMQDVERAVDNELIRLKEFARQQMTSLTLRYLGDVVRREYANVDLSEHSNLSKHDVEGILGRIGDYIFTPTEKNLLMEALLSGKSEGEAGRIIHHYFSKLQGFQDALRYEERNIASFADLCSQYVSDKTFSYDTRNFTFTAIKQGHGHKKSEIRLSDLSSGEKQIVSLFSHLHLSPHDKFFVIIDEPELSLSVPWQRRFLADIRNSGFCAGLVAATHSPFVYENELERFAHSMGEITTE